MGKISSDLEDLLASIGSAEAGPDGIPPADRRIYVYVRHEGELAPLVDAGFELNEIIPGVAQGDLSADQIWALTRLDDVEFISQPPPTRPALFASVPRIHADGAWNIGVGVLDDQERRGKGVIVGIVDTGIDVYHEAFRNPDGTTRILAIWDQSFKFNGTTPVDANGAALTGNRIPKDENGNTAAPQRTPKSMAAASFPNFNSGIMFEAQHINQALTKYPQGAGLPLSLCDADGHGTHVSGIAASGGIGANKVFCGVAPNADLVVVKRGDTSQDEISDITTGLEFLSRAARRLNKKCVANLSSGGHLGAHNGHDTYSKKIEQLMADNPGFLVVIAAGNESDNRLHAAMILRGALNKLILAVFPKVSSIKLIASVSKTASVRCWVVVPTNDATIPASKTWPGDETSVVAGHEIKIAKWPLTASTDPDSHFTIDIKPQAAGAFVREGHWELHFQPIGGDVSMHIWRVRPDDPSAAEFYPPDPSAASDRDSAVPWPRPEDWIKCSLTCNAATESAVVVANFDGISTSGFPIDSSSSQGPAPRDLNLGLFLKALKKPDICAPGVMISAPKANQPSATSGWSKTGLQTLSGTSMATPHVTGVAALLWAQDPTLTNSGIKNILLQTTQPISNPPASWVNANINVKEELAGAGLVDARAAVTKALE